MKIEFIKKDRTKIEYEIGDDLSLRINKDVNKISIRLRNLNVKEKGQMFLNEEFETVDRVIINGAKDLKEYNDLTCISEETYVHKPVNTTEGVDFLIEELALVFNRLV